MSSVATVSPPAPAFKTVLSATSAPRALLRLQRQRRPTRSRLTSAHTDTRDEQHESHLHLNERDAAADLRPSAHHHRQRRADIRETPAPPLRSKRQHESTTDR